MVVKHTVLVLVLFVRVHGTLLVYGGVWLPEHRGSVVWRCQGVLGRVMVVMRVCRLRVAPWHLWVRWQASAVVVGLSVVHVLVPCGPVRRVGWVACGPRLCSGLVMM